MQSAYRGSILHCLSDPGDGDAGDAGDAIELFEDGLLVVEDGRVAAIGDAATLSRQYPDIVTVDHGGKLIVPPTDVPRVGKFAVFFDPGGAGLAVLQFSEGAS